MPKTKPTVRHLVFILGDQLDIGSSALADFDAKRDMILMAEVREEATHVWSTKPRTAFFLSAMRHFREVLRAKKWRVDYRPIGAHQHARLADVLKDAIATYTPEKVVMVEAGDWRIEQTLSTLAKQEGFTLALRDDTHFMCSRHEFGDWAKGYKQLRLEFFYRMMRKRFNIMMDGDEPVQGRWNFDSENRGAFPKTGPGTVPPSEWVTPDDITKGVFADIGTHYADHPGSLDAFAWPVTREAALAALVRFVEERLPMFGQYQDAMWTDEPFLYHSHLSAVMNVKLISPREVIDAAVAAWQQGSAPIEAVEGFVRQVLGWREFMRGVYWLDMPGMRDANHFKHERALPKWYWTGDTHMRCMRAAVKQTLEHGYAHHIQRLMVTGIFGLLAELKPQEVEDWYLAVYVDAIDWVELPNVAGMALYANGGRFTSKPYVASGQYIKRMSNYCNDCRYKPDTKTGPRACPVTTLFWYHLDKHETTMVRNPRTSLMAKSIAKLSAEEREAVREQAVATLKSLDAL